nr:uncharacterized protein [Tanacetum cinerariifolium]
MMLLMDEAIKECLEENWSYFIKTKSVCNLGVFGRAWKKGCLFGRNIFANEAVIGWLISIYDDYFADMECLKEHGGDSFMAGLSVIFMWLGSLLNIDGSLEQYGAAYGSYKVEWVVYFLKYDKRLNERYLSYIMDVDTPTANCLSLVYNLLSPVMMQGHEMSTLSRLENRLLDDILDQTDQTLGVVFTNYKYMDENSPSGMMDVSRPATWVPPPVLEHVVELYKLTHYILSSEAKNKLCSYFQVAAKKRSRRHLTETNEYISRNGEGILMDPTALSTAYQNMKSPCPNIRNEIFTDIEIHNCHILPSFIDLPTLSSAVYSADLSRKLQAFL